jgi:hypothetical protein
MVSAEVVTPVKTGVQRFCSSLRRLVSGFPMKVHPVIPAKAGIQAVFLDSG